MLGLVLAAAVSEATLLRCGPMNVEPQIDGKISVTEMERSSATYGLTSDVTKLMATRGNVAFVGWTETGIYCAVRSALPPLPQRLCDKDFVSLVLQPPNGKPQAFAVSLGEGGKTRRPGNDFAWKVGPENTDKGLKEYGFRNIETEIFVPFSTLGVKKVENGEKWGLQVALVYASKPEKAFWHFSESGRELGTFIPDRKKCVVGMRDFDLRESWRSSANCMFHSCYFNPSDTGVRLTSSTVLHHGIGFSKLDANPETSSEVRHRSLGGDQLDCTVPAGEFREKIPIAYNLWPGTVNILDNEFAQDGETVYRRRTLWDVANGVKWETLEPMPHVYSGFYPTVGNRLRTGYTAWNVPDLVKAQIQVIGPEDKVFWDKVWEGKPKIQPTAFPPDFSLGELPVGNYRVVLTCTSSAGRVYTDEKTFAVKKFKWQNNKLGLDRVVIPPFKPLQNDAKGVTATMTAYRYGKGVLWDEVLAQGENILTAPIELKLNGESFKLKSSKIIESAEDRVIRELQAEGGKTRLTVVQDYDYDGFCMVTFKFDISTPVTVNSLQVVVPVRDELVSIYSSCCRNDRRDGPAPNFLIPAGDGEIWNSAMPERKLGEYSIGYLHPYVWFGGPEKGICWVAESHKNWAIDKSKPAQRMIRKNGTLTFECDIINVPTKWEKCEKEFRMAFQATPVKPFNDAQCRKAERMWDYPCPSNAVLSGVGTFAMCSSLITPMHTYPGKDRSLVEWGLKEAKRGITSRELHVKCEEYLDKHADWFRTSGYAVNLENYANGLQSWVRFAGGKYGFYLNPELNTCMWPEWEMYKAEWHCEAWPREDMIHEYLGRPGPSRNEKLLFDGYRALKLGYAGVYYDCFGAGGDLNYLTLTNGGYIAREYYHTPAASLTGVLEWRNLLKRSAIMCYKHGGMLYGQPYVELHATDCNIIPCTSWCSNTLCTERSARGGEFQVRFPEGYTLAEIAGRQSGAVPKIIVSAKYNDTPEQNAAEIRSLIGYMCAYGIFSLCDQGLMRGVDEFVQAWNIPFDYGWGDPEKVIQHWYYDGKPQLVKHTGKDIRLTIAEKKDGSGMLLMFGNLGEATEFSFAPPEGFKARPRFVDAMTGKDVKPEKMSIAKFGYRMVYVK